MRLTRQSPEAWQLQDIPPFFAVMLADLPRLAALHGEARERLYPDPVAADGAGDGLLSDWREHVVPGLERLFATSREIVARDIAAMDAGAESARLAIPGKNIDAWLNALNQARLVIAGRNGFLEADLDSREAPDLSAARGVDLLRLHFYAHLQEVLVGAAG